MRRTIVPILIVFLTCGIAVAVTRFLLLRQSSESVPLKLASVPIAKKANTVDYKGVRFTYDPSLASEVKSEMIPAMLEGKPSDIVPDHPAFTFVGYLPPKTLTQGDPQLRVFPLAKFREAVRIASEENAKSVVFPKNPPSWTIYFDEEVRTLKTLLAKRPTPTNLRSVIVTARRDRNNTQMPFLPMWEATQAFASHLRYVDFRNGRGVFFLTQWDTDTNQVTNEGLEYTFQGITDDGLYYIYAEFSVAAPFLPKGDERDVVAWNEKNYLLPHRSKEYQNYLGPVFAKLEALPATEFQPNLDLLEQLIGSLDVQVK